MVLVSRRHGPFTHLSLRRLRLLEEVRLEELSLTTLRVSQVRRLRLRNLLPDNLLGKAVTL